MTNREETMGGGLTTRWVMAMVTGGALAVSACSGRRDEAAEDSAAMATPAMTGAASAPAADAAGSAPAKPEGEMQAVLDQLATLKPKPLETLTPAEARKQPTPKDAVVALLLSQGKPTAPDASVATKDTTIPGPAGRLPVRIYTPKGASGPLPVVVYYHGGGWVIADKNVYDAGARAISKDANAIVVSVDYRLAPEHKFPAAHDDAFATYQWALANAAKIGGDPNRVATAGESAGGNLAVATAMAARDKGVKLPVHVLSVYPIAGTDTMTASYVENATAKPLSRPAMVWFLNNYTRSAADWQDPRINLVAADLKGLPPVTIITDQIDPLRSEGQTLAQKLKDAGVDVESRNYDGVAHEFFGMGAVLEKARDANQYGADGLKKNF
jgi:acetyl esterase/lipase